MDNKTVPKRKICLYCSSDNCISESRCIACGATKFSYDAVQINQNPQSASQQNTVPSQTNQQLPPTHTYSRSTSAGKELKDVFNKKIIKSCAIIFSIFVAISIISQIIAFIISINGENDTWDGWEEPSNPAIVTGQIDENISTIWFDFKVTSFEVCDSYTVRYLDDVSGNTNGRNGVEIISAGYKQKLYVVYLTLATPNAATDMNNFDDFSLHDDTTFYSAAASDVYGRYYLEKSQYGFKTVIVFKTRDDVISPALTYIEQEGSAKGTTYNVKLYDWWQHIPS